MTPKEKGRQARKRGGIRLHKYTQKCRGGKRLRPLLPARNRFSFPFYAAILRGVPAGGSSVGSGHQPSLTLRSSKDSTVLTDVSHARQRDPRTAIPLLDRHAPSNHTYSNARLSNIYTSKPGLLKLIWASCLIWVLKPGSQEPRGESTHHGFPRTPKFPPPSPSLCVCVCVFVCMCVRVCVRVLLFFQIRLDFSRPE